ncbi:aminopeptidase [Deinococcus metallilatus]|nr:aminopeptidase [Deinococcus metallilatus]
MLNAMHARSRPLPTRPRPPVWKWLLPAALVLGGGWGAWYWASRPHDPPVQTAALSRTASQDWRGLQAFGPRPVGSEGHDRAEEWLADQFRALGYPVTEQPVTLERPYDRGGTLKVGSLSVPAAALYGSRGGEQEGRLVRLPSGATSEQMEARGLRGQIALTTCQEWDGEGVTRRDLVERATQAGALGLVLVQDCAVRQLQRVPATPLPLVQVSAADGAKVLPLAGQPARLTSKVEVREVKGHNLIAARVEAKPEVLFGAHLDSVNDSPGANDNASGVLAVLEAAREAARTPLADRAWFVLFDAEEDGLVGSRAFVDAHRYPLRQTRAMLNLDMVGVNVEPLGVAAHAELLPLARRVRPGVRVFEDEAATRRETFGRSMNISGNSDQVPFQSWGVRTVFIHRGLDRNYHAATDLTLSPALVREAGDFAVKLAQAVLAAPWTPDEPCEGFRSGGC